MYDIICDIDGTIADIGHRLHHIENKPTNWPEFNKLCVDDAPIWPTIKTVGAMWRMGARIIMVSARKEHQRDITGNWMETFGMHDVNDSYAEPAMFKPAIKFLYERMYMRPDDNNQKDDEFKSDTLVDIIADGYRPSVVFDDRTGVVKMWRAKGLFVFDTNQSGKEY